MQIQMYSINPLDVKLRTEFVLGGDPYHPNCQDVRDMLEGLGVIFYRDEHHTEGLVFGEKTLTERGFIAYKHSAIVNDVGKKKPELAVFRVIPWPTPKAEYVAEKGDDRAWLQFNVQVRIASVTRDSVQLT